MWIMLNNAFLSIVDKSTVPGCLVVRSRRPGDIRRVFPKAKVRESYGTDYRYRADIPRAEAGEALARHVSAVDYRNFKDSVREDRLHNAYMRVWSAMAQLQPGGAYARDPKRQPEFWGDDDDGYDLVPA